LRPLLSSLETEYSLAAYSNRGIRVDQATLIEKFMDASRKPFRYLNDPGGGLYLANGARLYPDSGLHPEYACPECAGHPAELIAHLEAGHRIVEEICKSLQSPRSYKKVLCYRSNVDYFTRNTWGCHENYLSQYPVEHHKANLYALLAARPIIIGSGGFEPTGFGLRFSLAPRLHLFMLNEAPHSTHSRPIIHTKQEPHSSSYCRIHLICRESINSQIAEKVMAGLMRLVIRLGDRGVDFTARARTQSPLDALLETCLSTNPGAKARLLIGGVIPQSLSPVDTIRCYISVIRDHLSVLPDWTEEILVDAEWLLAGLENNPDSLFGILDWPTKKLMFEIQLGEKTWGQLEADSKIIDQVAKLCSFYDLGHMPLSLTAENVRDAIASEHVGLCDKLLKPKGGLSWLDEFAELRSRLLHIDSTFSDVGKTTWNEIRQPEERVVSESEIDKAMRNPPETTRAKLRGKMVHHLSGNSQYRADWSYISCSDQVMELKDPFESREVWTL
jgi:hypothetical protein